MQPFENRFLKTVVYLLLCAALPLTGCAYFQAQKTKAAKSKKSQAVRPSRSGGAKSQAKPMDPQAQQRYYDLGMKYYTEENYVEAKKAWQQVLQYGPNTPMADKARENLKKTDQVLKTLQEMEKKRNERP